MGMPTADVNGTVTGIVHVELTMRGLASRDQIEHHLVLETHRAFATKRVVDRINMERVLSDPEARTIDLVFNVPRFSPDEALRVAQAMLDFEDQYPDPVRTIVRNLRNEAEQALAPAFALAGERGVAIPADLIQALRVIPHAPTVTEDDLQSLQSHFGGRSRFRRMLDALRAPPAPKQPARRPEAFIAISFHGSLTGKPEAVAAVARAIEDGLSEIKKPTKAYVDYPPPEAPPPERRPLPALGEELLRLLREAGAALRLDDPAVFDHMDGILALMRAEPHLVRLLRHPPGSLATRNRRFDGRDEGDILARIEKETARCRRQDDLDGIGDLLFEPKADAQGLAYHLTRVTEMVMAGVRCHDVHEPSLRAVFGGAGNASLHLVDFFQAGHVPPTQRIRRLREEFSESLGPSL